MRATAVNGAAKLQLSSRCGRLFLLALALVATLMVLRTHFRLALVMGESMEPGLHPGDVLLIDKLAYRREHPLRGEIVVARYRNDLLVKRVVGLPGEVVQVQNGGLFIEGRRFAEPHRIKPGPLDIGAGRLLKGKYALLGDNRAILGAQNVHAVVSKDHLAGKVIFRIPYIRLAWVQEVFDRAQ